MTIPFFQQSNSVPKRVDIPYYRFMQDSQGFRIPFTPSQVIAYQRNISEKRRMLKGVKTPLEDGKTIDNLSSQVIEMLFKMMQDQQKRIAESTGLKKRVRAYCNTDSKRQRLY